MGIPDVAAYDTACQKVNALGDSVSYLGQSFGSEMSYESGLGFQSMAQYVANGMQLMNDGALDGSQIEQYTQVVSDLTTVLGNQAGEAAASAGTVGTTLSDGMADAMNTYDWNSAGSTVMSDIVYGFEAAGGDLSQVGDDIGAGIGKGEAAHDFSGDASTTISNDETALRSAAASQSPARDSTPSATTSRWASGKAWASTIFQVKRNPWFPPSRARLRPICSLQPVPRPRPGLPRA